MQHIIHIGARAFAEQTQTDYPKQIHKRIAPQRGRSLLANARAPPRNRNPTRPPYIRDEDNSVSNPLIGRFQVHAVRCASIVIDLGALDFIYSR